MHDGQCSQKCNQQDGQRLRGRHLWKFGFIAIASAIWFFLRTGQNPKRAVYPCQQVAVVNIQIFGTILLAFIPNILKQAATNGRLRSATIAVVLIIGSAFVTSDSLNPNFELSVDDYTRIPIDLVPITSSASENTSNLFFIQNATGPEGDMNPAFTALIGLMESQDLHLYRTSENPFGLIESNDVIILKMNGQWDYRGGTNTDLLKSVINTITSHPEGFTGEIVIADNGQGLGNLDRSYSNAYLRNQSMNDVAESFTSFNISTVLWDSLRYSTVGDYDEGDYQDGYVLSETWNEDTEIFTSYPKFETDYGTYISFKNGVWDGISGFDSDRLKVINMPVMKSHFRYGVTGCIKNYMGVPKGHVVSSVHSSIPHEHFSIGLGGMGTLMVETRAPILHILDMIWINPHPMESSTERGPWSTYPNARFTDIIGASQDPVALDYWASKNILCATADYLNYTEYSSLDPDYEPLSDQYYGSDPMDESFHNYLNRSMNILAEAGFQVTMNQTLMNVYVESLTGEIFPTSTPTSPSGAPSEMDLAVFALIPILIGIIALVAIIIRRRGT